MKKILLPVDGSDHAANAVRYVANLKDECGPLEVHLLCVEPQPQGWEMMGMETDAVEKHLRFLAHEKTTEARAILDGAGVVHTTHTHFGEVAQTIVDTALKLECDHIVMGTRGLGAVLGLAVGSVATKVLHLTSLPVTLVK